MGTTDGNPDKREAFAELYNEFLPRVFRYIRYRVNSQQVSEDLTSVVFEKALVSFERYSSDRASFSTWLFAIARNVVIDHFRARGRRPQLSLEASQIDIASGEGSPAELAEKKEEQARLQQALARLAPQEQDIISLKFASGLNNREIARALGISESNVGTRLYRTVRKLRDIFQEMENA